MGQNRRTATFVIIIVAFFVTVVPLVAIATWKTTTALMIRSQQAEKVKEFKSSASSFVKKAEATLHAYEAGTVGEYRDLERESALAFHQLSDPPQDETCQKIMQLSSQLYNAQKEPFRIDEEIRHLPPLDEIEDRLKSRQARQRAIIPTQTSLIEQLHAAIR